MTTFVGTDIGGTFTDLVGFDSESGSLLFGKRLTTSSDLVEAVMDCLDDVDISVADVEVLKHGTTQVINTLLELGLPTQQTSGSPKSPFRDARTNCRGWNGNQVSRDTRDGVFGGPYRSRIG